MDSMVKDKNNSDKSAKGREPNEMLDLLKTFYTPDEEKEIQDFSEFYSKLEGKLENENPSQQIASTTEDLEHQYLERQQRLEQFLRRMDETNFNPINKLKKKSKTKGVLVLVIASIAIAFTASYFFKNYDIKKKDAPDNKVTVQIPSAVLIPAES